MKVKLRVPLSSAPRELSSPLSKSQTAQEMDVDGQDDPQSQSDNDNSEAGSDVDENDQEERDELDELDELVDEIPFEKATPSSSNNSPRRNKIILKTKSLKPSGSVEASVSPSPSLIDADETQGDDSDAGSNDGRTKMLTGKKASAARIAEARSMSLAELDALPAAKRRKSHKARGAPGPGRGWRKGLTKGQKPVYQLPTLPIQETTPASFGMTETGDRSLPAPEYDSSNESNADGASAGGNGGGEAKPSTSAAAATATTATVATATTSKSDSGGGGGGVSVSNVADPPAKAGTAKNPGFRYPPLPSIRAGPPILPISRIPVAFQASIPIERGVKKEPRWWIRAKREILSIGGRPWSLPVYYGGEDRGYEKKKADPPVSTSTTTGTPSAAVAKGNTNNSGGGGGSVAANGNHISNVTNDGAAGGSNDSTENGKPEPSTPSGSHKSIPLSNKPTPSQSKLITTTTVATSSEDDYGDDATDPTNPTTSAPTAETEETGESLPGSPSKQARTRTLSPLPPPRHLIKPSLETNWRGQTPAYLASGR